MTDLMRPALFCFMLFALGGCMSGAKEQPTDLLKVKLSELSNEPIDFGQYKGKTVFINFWATWCKPCIQEMPTIEAAQAKLSNENVVFLLASNEDEDLMDRFIKKNAYQFHYVRLENMEALKIQALPTTFIFNGNGKLKFSEAGYRQWDSPANIELITKIMNDNE